MTTICQGGGLRSYQANGRQISKIVLFGDGITYYEVGLGWLETFDFDNGPTNQRDVTSITLDSLAVARKVNLYRTESYTLGDVLYLRLDEPPAQFGEFPTYQTATEECFGRFVEFPLKHTSRRAWDDGTMGEVVDGMVRIRVESRRVATAFGKHCDETAEMLTASGIDIPSFQLEKLLMEFELKPRLTKGVAP